MRGPGSNLGGRPSAEMMALMGMWNWIHSAFAIHTSFSQSSAKGASNSLTEKRISSGEGLAYYDWMW